MPTPNVLGIIQQGIDRGELDPKADVPTKRDYVNAYAIEHARDENEYTQFVSAAEPAFHQMHLDEVDPTGELRKRGAQAAAERAANKYPVLQQVSDVAAGAVASGARIAGGIAGIFSPSAGQHMRNVAEQTDIANDLANAGFAKEVGGFVPYVAGGAGLGIAGATTAMFGAGAGTAQEQGATGAASAVYGALNAGVGLATGMGLGKVAGKYLTAPVAEAGVRGVQKLGESPVAEAFIRRVGQGVAGDIGFGVGAPVGQAAADTLQIGPGRGLEDLKEIPASLVANLALGPLAHGLKARAEAIKDVAKARSEFYDGVAADEARRDANAELARLPGEADKLGVDQPRLIISEHGDIRVASGDELNQPGGPRTLPGVPAIETPRGMTDVSTGLVPTKEPSGYAPGTGRGVPAIETPRGMTDVSTGLAPNQSEAARKATEAKANQAEAEGAAQVTPGEFFPRPSTPKFSELPGEKPQPAPEPAKVEPAKVEPAKVEPAKVESTPVAEKVELAVNRGPRAKKTLVTPEHIEGNASFFIAHNEEGQSVPAQYVEGSKPLTIAEAAGNPKARVRAVRITQDAATRKNTIDTVATPKEVKALWTTPEAARAAVNLTKGEAPVGRQAVRETKADLNVAEKAATYDPVDAAKGVIERYEAAPIKTRADEEAHFAKEKPEDLHSFLTHGDARDLPPEIAAKVRAKEPLTKAEQAEVDGAKKVLTPHVREMVTHARDKALNRQEGGVISKSEAINAGLNVERHAAGSVGEESGSRKVSSNLVATMTRLVGEGGEIEVVSDNQVKMTMPNGHSITIIKDTTGHLPKGTLGSVRTEVAEGATHSTIYLHPNASPGVLAHEVGHIKLDHFLNANERKLLLSRVTDAQIKRTLAKYEKAGVPVSEAKAREEAALDRLKDYENHGVLERSIWQRLHDFAKEIAKHFGLGEGSEKQIMDQMLGGEFFKRMAREAGDATEQHALAEELANFVAHPITTTKGWSAKAADFLDRSQLHSRIFRVRSMAKQAATPEAAARLNDMADKMEQADQEAFAHRAEAAEFMSRAMKELHLTGLSGDKAKDFRDTATTEAPSADFTGGVNSKMWDAIESGGSLPGFSGKMVKALREATTMSGKWLREAGLKTSGRVPRSIGKDFHRVLSGNTPGVREAYFKYLAEVNGESYDEVAKHFESTGVDRDVSVNLSPAELSRRFEKMPQTFFFNGDRYEMHSLDPTFAIKSIIDGSAHRAAAIKALGKGYDAAQNLPEWSEFSTKERGIYQDWLKAFHGKSLGPMIDTATSRAWVGDVGQRVNEFVGLNKMFALIGAAPGDVAGTLNIGTVTGVKAAARAIAEGLTSPRRIMTEATRSGLTQSMFQSALDPSSFTGTWMRTATDKIGRIKQITDNWSAAVAGKAARYALEDMAAAARAGKPDRFLQKSLKGLGFTEREIKALTVDGSATEQLKTEFVRRTMTSMTGAATTKGNRAAWADQWLMQKLGPGFTSWADAQLARRAKLVATIARGEGGWGPAAVDLMGITVAGATAASFWSLVQGGDEGLTQQWDRPALDQVTGYAASGAFGGLATALYGATQSDGQLKKFLGAVSFPAGQVYRLGAGAEETLKAWQNGEFISGFMEAGAPIAPVMQKMRDAYAWTVEAKNPGTLRKALSEFYKWKEKNPELAGGEPAQMIGGEKSDTTKAIDRVIREVKYGDRIDMDRVRSIIRSSFMDNAAREMKGAKAMNLRSMILGRRMLDSLPPETRDQALGKLRQDLGGVTMERLLRHDLLLETLADMVD